MKKLLVAVLSAVLVLSLAACGGKAEKKELTLATGGTSGTYYAVGNTMATVLNDHLTLTKLNVTSTGASKANVQLVTGGDAQLAILQSDVLNYAHTGTGGESMFEGKPEAKGKWIAGLYNETVQIVATGDIKSVADLKGKAVCVGDVGSGTALNAAQVLEAYGMSFSDVKVINASFGNGADMIKNGTCDAAFTVAGAPTSALTDLFATASASLNLHMLSLDANAVSYLTSHYPFLVQEDLPANTYNGQTAAVTCVAVKAVLVASEDVSTDAVYELTKALFDNNAALTSGHAKFTGLTAAKAIDGSFDLHPGAEKYYKEVGAIK